MEEVSQLGKDVGISSQSVVDPKSQTVVEKKVMKEFPKNKTGKQTMMLVVGALVIILAGVGTGWILSNAKTTGGPGVVADVAPGAKDNEDEAGIMDESGFEKEAPEGILKEGGINGEGTHYLDRGLGEEKNVYLTSTVLDLQSFVGKNVKIWGNTVAAIDAPWLMDVGKIKVVK
ncbi:hypothetical protein IPM62_04975 [Candidatus Woesebacteria bacterium]|nr:MAG: hypothetical protein IPM62_04975 [Candidatus Woesebacteria bacterium]